MKITAKIQKSKKNDLERLVKHLRRLTNSSVEVGYFSETGTHSTAKIPYAELMKMHEDGEGVPSRPAMWIGSSELIRGTHRAFDTIVKDSIAQVGRLSPNLNKAADYMVSTIQDVFGDTSLLLSNSERTVQLKGKDAPLIDTNELRDNMDKRVEVGK